MEIMTTDQLKIEDLKHFIKKNDVEKVLLIMETMKAECLNSEQLHLLITSPMVITELHRLVEECMGVNKRAMRLKNRVINTRRRAMLFLQAMMNGIKLKNG